MPKLLQVLLAILLISLSSSLNCGGQEIKNCLECGTKPKTCSKCPETHFLFNHDMLCVSCDDFSVGDVGCEKNCVFKNGFLECEENSCKEGYYNIDGSCWPCSKSSANCTKCEYKIISGREKEGKIFKCLECNNTNYTYLSEIDGKCHSCSHAERNWTGNCSKCHFDETNLTCDFCEEGYYKTPNLTCTKCHNVSIYGGQCDFWRKQSA